MIDYELYFTDLAHLQQSNTYGGCSLRGQEREKRPWSALVHFLVTASGNSLIHDVCSLVQGLKQGSCRHVFVVVFSCSNVRFWQKDFQIPVLRLVWSVLMLFYVIWRLFFFLQCKFPEVQYSDSSCSARTVHIDRISSKMAVSEADIEENSTLFLSLFSFHFHVCHTIRVIIAL